MRLWSLHPKYLDSKGLVALWREGLLAKAVLEGHTKGYKNHPQLKRFKATDCPADYLNQYLWDVADEAHNRGYKFNITKLYHSPKRYAMQVTEGQVQYERQWLLSKLKERAPHQVDKLAEIRYPITHPLFYTIPGDIAEWEKVKEEV